MSKHSPSPWIVLTEVDYGIDIYDAKARWVASVLNSHKQPKHFPSDDQCRRNARLIAAAPDLLEASKEAMTTINAMLDAINEANDAWAGDNQKKWHGFCETFDKISAALNKAEGKK